MNIVVYDPWANSTIAEHEYGIKITNTLPTDKFDAAIMAVAHNEFKELDVVSMLNNQHVIFDVKGFMNRESVDGRL